jgi:5'-phosphate synthase pdxT subunit
MAKLLDRLDMKVAFIDFIRSRPVWGTCAGMVLLAKSINDDSITPFGVIDIAVERNGYGRQVFSTTITSSLKINGRMEELDMVFIRAPRVIRIGKGVKTLLKRDSDPVLLTQKNVMVSAFHPELSGSNSLHNYFSREFMAV